MAELTDFSFTSTLEYDSHLLVAKGLTPEASLSALQVARERAAVLPDWTRATLEEIIGPLAGELGLKTGQLFGILRVASAGRTAAPPLFETIEVLGRERAMARLGEPEERLRQLATAPE